MMLVPSGRNMLAALLVVATCLLVSISVPVIWLRQVVMDTDTYVQTVAPLSDDPAIKDAMARYITDRISEQVDTEEIARAVLPGAAEMGAGTLASMAQGFLQEQVREQLDEPEFSDFWVQANRGAHSSVMDILVGERPPREAILYLDLNVFWEVFQQRMAAKGIPIFLDVEISGPGSMFPLFRLRGIGAARQIIGALERLSFWLPALAAGTLATALVVAKSRRRVLIFTGLGVAAGMAGMLLAIILGRELYLQGASAAGDIDLEAAGSFYRVITASLRNVLGGFILGGLGLTAAAFLLGRR